MRKWVERPRLTRTWTQEHDINALASTNGANRPRERPPALIVLVTATACDTTRIPYLPLSAPVHRTRPALPQRRGREQRSRRGSIF
jgi:hypothetical protein